MLLGGVVRRQSRRTTPPMISPPPHGERGQGVRGYTAYVL